MMTWLRARKQRKARARLVAKLDETYELRRTLAKAWSDACEREAALIQSIKQIDGK